MLAPSAKLYNARARANVRAPSARAARRHVAARAAVDTPSATSPATSSSSSPSSKRTVVITGASSGLGLNAANSLIKNGWHVVCAVRDFAKMEMKATQMNFPKDSFSVYHCDLASQKSVRAFAEALQVDGVNVDVLICNAALYLPSGRARWHPQFTADGFELSMASNHLGHFKLVHELFPLLKASAEAGRKPRCIILGSVTGNTNTVAGQVPPKANLGDLSGLAEGAPLADKSLFDGAKAYKDSKLCNMLTMRELENRYNDSGIIFSSLYPGCIAETGLFRNHTNVFRFLFPLLQKNLTKGYVSEEEAGDRLATIAESEDTAESGQYWAWRGGGDDLVENYNTKDRGTPIKNQPSTDVQDDAKAKKLFEISMDLCNISEFGAPAPVAAAKSKVSTA